MTTETAEKSMLQIFLEEVRRIVHVSKFHFASPAEMQLLIEACRHGSTPQEAAARFTGRRAAFDTRNHDAYLADVNDGLRNQAYAVEKEIEKLSNQIVAATKTHGAVTGLLYFSHPAQDLPRLGAKLKVFNECADLLRILRDSTGSANLAVEATRAEAVLQLVNLREVPDSKEHLGASEALKLVIKILDNSL